MTILALDLGTRTGWAFWDGQRRESGVQLFDVKRGESPGMRYLRFNAWLGFAAGDGNAKKPAMVAAARTRFGYAGGDEDEADAICLLAYASAELIVMPSASGGAGNRGRA